MDRAYYDKIGAGVALQEYIAVRSAGKHTGQQIVNFNKVSETDMLAVEFDTPKCIKLVIGSSSHGVGEEAVLRLQGILWKSALPPVRANPWLAPVAARFIRQTVTLVGLGAESFDQIVANMSDVGEFMGRQIIKGEVKPWQPMHVGDDIGISLSNRYFTWRRSIYTGESIDFPKLVDPKDTLAGMAGDDYVHTIDNTVDYSECNVVDGGHNEYRAKDPSTFTNGDIVEAKLTFVIKPLDDGSHHLVTTLRGLTLLDDSYSKSARVKRRNASEEEKRTMPVAMKRSKGIDETDDDVRETAKRLKFMEIYETQERSV